MSNGRPPLQFPSSAGIPLLGQICAFHDVQPDVVISCNCDGPYPDRLIRLKAWAAVGMCRACKRLLAIKALHFIAETQQVQIEIVPVMRRDATDEAPALAAPFDEPGPSDSKPS